MFTFDFVVHTRESVFFWWSLLNSTSGRELLPRTNAIAHTERALLTHPPKMFGFSDFCSFGMLASLRHHTPGVDLCPLRSVSKARLKHGAEWEKIILYVNAKRMHTHFTFSCASKRKHSFLSEKGNRKLFFLLSFSCFSSYCVSYHQKKNCLNLKFFLVVRLFASIAFRAFCFLQMFFRRATAGWGGGEARWGEST